MPLLLVLGYVWPEPKSSAAGWRMLSLLELFRAKGYRIIFASPAELSMHRVDLTALGISEVQIELNSQNFDDQLKQWQPDVVLFDRFMLEEQFGWRVDEHCPNALKLLDSEDLHCLRHARQQAFKQKRALEQADLRSEMAVREIAAIHRCDLTLTISEFEMTLLQQEYGVAASQLLYVPFLLNELSKQHPIAFAQRQHCCFIGNFRHEPNWQTVLKLKQLWPAIRQQLPKVELHIYGAYPPPKATALHNPATGFLIKGWADDSQQVLANSRLCLAPIPFGAGLKGKFIDTMQVGTPSVTSSIGAEGMTEPETGAWCGRVTDDDETFINSTVSLYQNQQQWHDAQKIGFDILVKRFDSTQLIPVIWQRMMAVKAQLPEHRLANFVGTMLKHHHLRSTKYMAQWIEAKNRANQRAASVEGVSND